MNLGSQAVRRRLLGRSLAAALCMGAGLTAAACGQNPVAATLRSLQGSGPISFVCLGAPGTDLAETARPLTDCTSLRTDTIDDFTIPHLYALVTQPITGEIAIVDLTTEQDAVLDADPTVPGTGFIPVGAQPVDVVSTPGSMASFVAVAEPGFESIYALPSDRIRGGAPRLTSFPLCALPAAPGRMTLFVDRADETGAIRPRCDVDYGADEVDEGCDGVDHCNGDLRADAERVGTPGRYKLAVTLPSEGGIVILDAQDILDQPDGAFGACPIERWLPLDVVPPAPEPLPGVESDGACVPAEGATDALAISADTFLPEPAGIANDGRTVYVADRRAPVIHRLDLNSPCEPVQLPSLGTRSLEDRARTVVTSDLSVTPLTSDLRRFLYAIDERDGSIMVYDVSPDAGSVFPLSRPRAELNPFQPADRIRYGAPPRALASLALRNDNSDATTGATLPLRCDPDPAAEGAATTYRTTTDLDGGASPLLLRGVFTFAILESGDIVFIDVDDLDADCRGPVDETALAGCEPPLASGLSRPDEFSCRVVSPHESRAALYLLDRDNLAENEPGIGTFPLLFDAGDSVIQLDDLAPDDTSVPRMRATVPVDGSSLRLSVGSDNFELSEEGLALTATGEVDPEEHTLAMNFEDPRAHILDQGWSVTYEGPLPGFTERFATLEAEGDGQFILREGTSRFCRRGVKPEAAYRAEFEAEGLAARQAQTLAETRADYVQIISATPVETDPYWSTVEGTCSFQSCQQQFGNRENLRVARDFRIVEGTEEELELVSRSNSTAPVNCCFPGVVEFNVRSGSQWTVFGSSVGFLHNMTTDDEGRCRPSCDPNLSLRRGRALETAEGRAVTDEDPVAFRNPFFRFAINSSASERDMVFQFSNNGAFVPLTRSVVTNTNDVQPSAVTFLPATGELVV
ncbi:MAG: hypothetical protein AAGA56_01255, partial [Myxococcota bacterium]